MIVPSRRYAVTANPNQMLLLAFRAVKGRAKSPTQTKDDGTIGSFDTTSGCVVTRVHLTVFKRAC
eukprot:12420322-Karenia_brevis.AAC.1